MVSQIQSKSKRRRDKLHSNVFSPDLRVRVSFWGWIWVISSGFSFSAPFLRFVTVLFLRTVCSPCGSSIMALSQPLFIRDCSSSQRVDTVSPCFRNFYEGRIKGTIIRMKISLFVIRSTTVVWCLLWGLLLHTWRRHIVCKILQFGVFKARHGHLPAR